jgi:hypothetical protein
VYEGSAWLLVVSVIVFSIGLFPFVFGGEITQRWEEGRVSRGVSRAMDGQLRRERMGAVVGGVEEKQSQKTLAVVVLRNHGLLLLVLCGWEG